MASGGVTPALSIMEPQETSETTTALSKLNPEFGLSESSANALKGASNNTNAPVKICVFCGASPGTSPAHMEAARSLAETFHKHNISLIYGGGFSGLMGEIARTLVSLSGPDSVHGIIPAPLMQYERRGRPHPSGPSDTDSELPDPLLFGHTTVVPDMHTRKHQMAAEVLSGGPGSGFIALSGGYGTLEELMEIVTWNQLGIHNRGVVVYNVEGYWDGLLDWVNGAVKAGFVKDGSKDIIEKGETAEECVKALRDYKVKKGRFELQWGNT